MKYILGVLCFCFLSTYTSAASEPLCNMRTMVTNETWIMQTFYGLFRGDRRALECLAGCGIYTFDSMFGGFLKNIAGPVYALFENCVKAGQRRNNTCQITDCVVNLLLMGIDFARTMNIKIPFIDQIEWLIAHRKTQYTVDNGPAQQNNGQQPILAYPSPQNPIKQPPLPQQTPAPPPPPPALTPLPQPETTRQPHKHHSSASRVVPTLVLLQICGYFFFKQFIF